MRQGLTLAMLLVIAAPMQVSAQDADIKTLNKRAEELFYATNPILDAISI
jgi:hypothetical protein